MSAVRRETTRNSETLQQSLSAIFLSIGNAYYEANKSLATKSTVIPVNVESNKQIRQGRATFLDSLDQLEIIVMRTTEVLQARARQRHPELFIKDAPPETNGISAVTNKEGPSPETMLLNGEGLTSTTDGEPTLDLSADLPNEMQNDMTDMTDSVETNGVQQTIELPDPMTDVMDDLPKVDPEIVVAAPAESTINNVEAATNPETNHLPPAPEIDTNVDEEMMNLEGPIDFGDMDFDNFNFDDTAHFDFGSMIED